MPGPYDSIVKKANEVNASDNFSKRRNCTP